MIVFSRTSGHYQDYATLLHTAYRQAYRILTGRKQSLFQMNVIFVVMRTSNEPAMTAQWFDAKCEMFK